MARQRTTKTKLTHGQSLRQYACCGTIVVAASGMLRVTGAPVWLGERILSETACLREGEPHLVRQTGWIAIQALNDAEVVCVTPEALWPKLSRWCRMAAAGLHRGWKSLAQHAGGG